MLAGSAIMAFRASNILKNFGKNTEKYLVACALAVNSSHVQKNERSHRGSNPRPSVWEACIRPLSYGPRHPYVIFGFRRLMRASGLIKKKGTARSEDLAVPFIFIIGLQRAPVRYEDGYPWVGTCPPPVTGPRPETGLQKIVILQRKMDGIPSPTGSRATIAAREPVRAILSSTGIGKYTFGMPPGGGFPCKTLLGRGKNAIARTRKNGRFARLRAPKK